MKVDYTLISHLEHLARLELSEMERQALMDDLNKILAMVEKLQELNLEGIVPKVYLNEAPNPLRTDEVRWQSERTDALLNAPEHDGVYFLTPKVIEIKQ